MDSYLLLTLLTLTIFLMFSSCHGYSESMSCSYVNGRMICEKKSGTGNVAGAFAGSLSGHGGPYQDAGAMVGNTHTGQSDAARTVLDGNTLKGYGVPSFYPNSNSGWMHGSGQLSGTGASEATSFRSDTGPTGISTSGFAGTSNNYGIPGAAFGGFAAADPSGNSFYGGGNTYGGGYANGYGNPGSFNFGPGFPFNMFGKKR